MAPARFPRHLLRYRNQRWAAAVGLVALDDAEWARHFAAFEPLPDNLPQALALRYHGHQFRIYNRDLGDGRGFVFGQLRDAPDRRLLDLGTKGSGQTPWSRGGDGRLTLKGGVREASYFQRATPCTLLIDEIEALWTAIAERDDWSPFNAKLAAIAELRAALVA